MFLVAKKSEVIILNISRCRGITNDIFKHLKHLKHLDMSITDLTDDALQYFQNIETLEMYSCDNITSGVLKYLVGVKKLRLPFIIIYPEDFKYLKGIKVLNMMGCKFENGIFEYLKGIKELSVSSIPDEAFKYLNGIKKLTFYHMDIHDKYLENLKDLEELDVCECSLMYISNESFKHLSNVKYLIMDSQTYIKIESFKHLKNLRILVIYNFDDTYNIQNDGDDSLILFNGFKIDEDMFNSLTNLKELRLHVSDYYHPTINIIKVLYHLNNIGSFKLFVNNELFNECDYKLKQ